MFIYLIEHTNFSLNASVLDCLRRGLLIHSTVIQLLNVMKSEQRFLVEGVNKVIKHYNVEQ